MFVSRWTVDYGDGPHPVILPHAWGGDVSVEWEGPAIYRTEVEVPRTGGTLRFGGVSCRTEVSVNGTVVAHHTGIWDAFDVPLPGGKVEVEVRVTKNGGATTPNDAVASGGLPDLFHSFGGIYREVELLEVPSSLEPAAPETRPELPFIRGVVHRGWYPDLGHPNPDDHLIRRELREIKTLGFNLVKFVGWVPPHRYLDLLESEGLLGWLELPMGETAPDAEETVLGEVERIVRQYRRHRCLAIWSFGSPVSPEIVGTVRALTRGAWVGDVLDGAGTFADVTTRGTLASERLLDSLFPGPREPRPILVSEEATAHAHRDLARLGDELPYWASSLPELGGRHGRRLAAVLDRSRFALEPTKSGHKALLASSRSKEAFARKRAVEAIRARAAFVHGYVLAELRDTPVSSAGILDDWGSVRLDAQECAAWNGTACLFPISPRTFGPYGVCLDDPLNHFEGDVRLSLGLHSEAEVRGMLWWRIVDEGGRTVARGTGAERSCQGAQEVGEIVWNGASPGSYRLEAGFGATENAWDLWVVGNPQEDKADGVFRHRPNGASGGVLLLDAGDEGTQPIAMDHGGALEFRDEAFWATVPFRERWQRLLSISARATLDPQWLKARFGPYEVLLNRIGTSPEELGDESPILVRTGSWLITTLRVVPNGCAPAGAALLRALKDVERA